MTQSEEVSSSSADIARTGSLPVLTSDAEPSAAETRLSWWWSRDDERFYGPNYSRADAIMDAWADDPDQGAWICQASPGKWRTEIIDAEWLGEAFDDANEEMSDPDGDGPSHMLTEAEWRKLAKRLNEIVRATIREKGLMAWGFDNQHPSEWVNVHLMWRAAEEEEDARQKALSQAGTAERPTEPREASK